MFILKRITGGYVAPVGSPQSYVSDGMKARRFATREEAERNRCIENEIIISVLESR